MTRRLTAPPAYRTKEPDKTPDGKENIGDKPHQWESDWLNHPNGGATCRVCGCTKRTDLVRADRSRPGEKTQLNHYVDAAGNAISTFEELSCPVWIGDPGSAAAQAKEGVRKVKGRVGDVENKVEVVEDKVESLEDRMARLEAENEALKAEVARKQEVDVTILMEWLTELAQQAARSRSIEAVEARGVQYQVPRQIVDVIDIVSLEPDPREKVLIPARPIESEETE